MKKYYRLEIEIAVMTQKDVMGNSGFIGNQDFFEEIQAITTTGSGQV